MIVRLADLTFPDTEVADRAIETIASVSLPLVESARGFEGGWLLLGDPQGAVLVTVWRDEASHDAAVEQMTDVEKPQLCLFATHHHQPKLPILVAIRVLLRQFCQ